MAIERKEKPSDQKKVQIAYETLYNIIKSSSIEPSLWVTACYTLIVNCFITSDISYDQFCNELEEIKIHYKQFWEKC